MSEERISRRRMLKRIGAGAAVAWSAPVITSLTTPAFAQYPVCDCISDPCNNPCGAEGCLCAQTTENDCDCFIPVCGEPCNSSSDCGAGRRCVVVCCDIPVCADLCSGSSGRRPKGRGWSKA
jgi:hypothetical protein